MNSRLDNYRYFGHTIELPLCFDSFPNNNNYNYNYHILHDNEFQVGPTPVNDDIGISRHTFISNILLDFCRNPCVYCYDIFHY